MPTIAVATPLGINQYSPLSIQEVPNSDNDNHGNIPNATQVAKPTARSDGNQTKCKHLNINTEAGTQTQKDQHQPRNKGSCEPKGQEPKNQQHDNLTVVVDSILKFIDVTKTRKRHKQKTYCEKLFLEQRSMI